MGRVSVMPVIFAGRPVVMTSASICTSRVSKDGNCTNGREHNAKKEYRQNSAFHNITPSMFVCTSIFPLFSLVNSELCDYIAVSSKPVVHEGAGDEVK